jgi:hypothetical protein
LNAGRAQFFSLRFAHAPQALQVPAFCTPKRFLIDRGSDAMAFMALAAAW